MNLNLHAAFFSTLVIVEPVPLDRFDGEAPKIERRVADRLPTRESKTPTPAPSYLRKTFVFRSDHDTDSPHFLNQHSHSSDFRVYPL